MYASQYLCILVGCIGFAFTTISNSTLLQLNATSTNATSGTFGLKDYFAVNSLVNVSVNAQDDVAVNTSQSLANLLTGHFNDTCPLGSSQKRLGKRTVTDTDVGCVSNSVFSLARFVATNPAVQNDISSVPSNFNVQGQLVRVVNQVKAMVQQQPQLFSGRIFSPAAIVSTLAYLTSLAYIVWKYGPGTEITQIIIPYVDVAASALDSTSSCSSWTFSFTSPTPSTTVVPALPCQTIQTAVPYLGPNPSDYLANQNWYSMMMTAPICWPTTTSMAGSSSVDCVCAASSTATARYSTISGASGPSACAYTATSDLPSPIATEDPSKPGDIICRPGQWWYSSCQLPNIGHFPNTDLLNCITGFSNPAKNPTWPADGMMQPGSANVSLSCLSNKNTVYFSLLVSWIPNCQASTSNGKMSIMNPTGQSSSTSTFSFANIIQNIYTGCLNFATYLDPTNQMFGQILGSAGLGTNIGNLPHPGDVRAATNWGVGGRRQIGCLEYEWFPTKNEPGIPPKDLTTLGEVYYALPGGNGEYCPNPYNGCDPLPCPAFPCYNGDPSVPVPTCSASPNPNPGGIPNHDEFLVQHNNVANNTASLTGPADANSPSSSNSTASLAGAAGANTTSSQA